MPGHAPSEARVARRHDGRGRLPHAGHPRVCPRHADADARGLDPAHDQRGRAGGRGPLHRRGEHPFGTGRRGRGAGLHRPGGRLREVDRLRHGRHEHGREPLRRRLRVPLRDGAARLEIGHGRADRRAHDGRRDRRGRRRLDLLVRRAEAGRGARERRRRSGARLLRPRRTALPDGCEPVPRPDSARPVRVPAGPRGGGVASPGAGRPDRGGDGPALSSRGARGRFRRHRQCQHGRADQEGLGRAGLRRA